MQKISDMMSFHCKPCPKQGRRDPDNTTNFHGMTYRGLFERAQMVKVFSSNCYFAARSNVNWVMAAALYCLATSANAALASLTVQTTLSPQAADFSDQALTFSQFDP